MGPRNSKPTRRGTPPAGDFSDDAPTSVYDSGEHGPSRVTDERTTVDPPASASQPIKSFSMMTPAETSRPIQSISMKTPADPSIKPIAKIEREMPHVKLRAMSELAKAQQPQNLGNLAPPYDPAEARARSMRDYVVWGCVGVILASAIALGVWFVGT